MMIKSTLKWIKNFSKSDAEQVQAGARSAVGTSLNYLSVNTLDPVRLARAFSAADQGYLNDQATLFELVEEQDTHIFSDLTKRRRAVTGLNWQLMPPKDATQSEVDRTAELEAIIRNITEIEDAQYDLTDAIGKGFTALEIEWQTGSTWYPRHLHFVPQRMFQVCRDTGNLMYVKNGLPEPLRPGGWIVHEHRAKSGYIEQAALFRVLAWTYAYKAYNTRDMQRFLELYGIPLRLGKYPSGISQKQRDELLRAVRNIGNDGAGIVPVEMAIEFVQAQNGKVDDFLSAIEYWEKKQSLAILGGTLTSQADGRTSTNALGLVHDKVRREIMLHDVRQIEPTQNSQLVEPIALINGMFPQDRMPRLHYDTAERVDQEKMVTVLKTGASIGMQIDVAWAHEAMQIPRAGKDATILTVQSPFSMPTETGAGSADLSRKAALTTLSGDPRSIDGMAASLADACVPHEEQTIRQIYEILSESADFDEAIERIEQLRLDTGKYAETIASGLAAANLAGRAQVPNGD